MPKQKILIFWFKSSDNVFNISQACCISLICQHFHIYSNNSPHLFVFENHLKLTFSFILVLHQFFISYNYQKKKQDLGLKCSAWEYLYC